MCCVWAATRDVETVEHVELNDPDSEVWMFADNLPFWHGAHVLAWQSRLLVEAGNKPLPDLGVALRQLQEHAARGTIIVRGKRLGDGLAEAIPVDAWADLQIVTWTTMRGFVAASDGLQVGVWWSRLRVLPDELLKVWPRVPDSSAPDFVGARRASSSPVTASHASDVARLLDQAMLNAWMRERFTTWPADKLPPTRTEDTRDARAVFTSQGYKIPPQQLPVMIAVARKAEAEPWTRTTGNGRKMGTPKVRDAK
jgi:hypothetical protein